MGVTRVTPGLIIERVLTNLNAQSRRILELQEQLSSGLRVNRPSDDPIDARRAVSIRQQISENEQFQSNITDASPHLSESSSQFEIIVDVVQRANVLTLQGANETNNQLQLDTIALEINQLLETVLESANHQTNRRFIFGGTRTLQVPFVATRSPSGDISAVAYTGNQVNIEVEIATNLRVVINENGARAFQSSVDLFQTLIGIRDDLRAGNQANLSNTRLDELETARNQVLLSQSRIGAVQNRLEQASASTEDFVLQLRAVLSDKIEADFADVVVNLNSQQNAYTAALNAAGRVIQPSLLDFLR